MTWNELNQKCDDMLPDMLGAEWYGFVDDGYDDEPLYRCGALEAIKEVLYEITHDSDCPEDYSSLIAELGSVR